MIFGVGSAFSKGPGSAFSEGPGPGPGPLYKVCLIKEQCLAKTYLLTLLMKEQCFLKKELKTSAFFKKIYYIVISTEKRWSEGYLFIIQTLFHNAKKTFVLFCI